MSIDAIAILNVPYLNACKEQSSQAARTAAVTPVAYPFKPVGSDATACSLGIGFGTEPEELAAYVRQVAGTTLDLHQDPRGVFVVPSVAWKSSYSSYQAVLDEVGELGQWVTKMSAEVSTRTLAGTMHAMGASNFRPSNQLRDHKNGEGAVEAGASTASAAYAQFTQGVDIQALAAQMSASGSSGMGGQIQDLIAANPGLAEVAERVLGGQETADGSALGADPGFDIMQAAQAMLSQMNPEQMAQIEKMAMGMFGQMQGGPASPNTNRPTTSNVHPSTTDSAPQHTLKKTK
jgi:hypothetical protein